MPPSAQREGAACPICLEVLETGSGVISLAPCGHILHRACFDDWAAAAGPGNHPPLCPMCRCEVAADRIKSASLVPGGQLAGNAGYAQYALRSVLPGPLVTTPAGGRGGNSSAHPAADIPARARDMLLDGISAQLGAASPAAAAAPAAGSSPSTWCFALDVSGSMGSSRDWQPASVSRLCFALASLACVVDAKVAPGDWVTVQAFDDDQATLKQWFRKPAAFDKAGFLAELTGAVRTCGLERGGTGICAAVELAVHILASKANSLAAPQDGASSGGPQWGGNSEPELAAAHSLVLVTDGYATDEAYGFARAVEALRQPPIEADGFRALLLHIADDGRSSRCLTRLASDAAGAPLEYVQLVRLQMGASLNLTPQPASAGGPEDHDWRSVRAFGDGVSAFIMSPTYSRSTYGGSHEARSPTGGAERSRPYSPTAPGDQPANDAYNSDTRAYSPTTSPN